MSKNIFEEYSKVKEEINEKDPFYRYAKIKKELEEKKKQLKKQQILEAKKLKEEKRKEEEELKLIEKKLEEQEKEEQRKEQKEKKLKEEEKLEGLQILLDAFSKPKDPPPVIEEPVEIEEVHVEDNIIDEKSEPVQNTIEEPAGTDEKIVEQPEKKDINEYVHAISKEVNDKPHWGLNKKEKEPLTEQITSSKIQKQINDLESQMKRVYMDMSSINISPGSGEVRILNMDDVDTSSLANNKILSYRSASGTFVFADEASASGSKHTVQNAGSNLTARTNLNFDGTAIVATDDSGNDQTDVTLGGYLLGGTSPGTTAVADDDGIVTNDGGTMRQTKVQTFATYFASEITAMGNLVETGALNAGSITSGFGAINNGSSDITTTGLISGGSLDIDDVLINGATIGHTDDTDLLTLADGKVTVAGELQATTLDIGGTNITATAAEINLIDGGTSRGTTAIADGDGVLINDDGTMRMTTVQTLAAYLDDEITAMPNLTSVGTLTSLTVDNIIINGTNIGHTSDTDAIAIASNGNVTISQNLSVTGDLTISGTTTTVDSTVLTVVDPIIHLQTATGGGALGSDTNKDVGLAMQYHNGSAAKTAFVGFDDDTGKLIFVPDATINSEVVSGTAGTIVANLEGDVTGTLQTAAQGNVTSLGTLTALTVDNVAINGATIGHTDDTDLMTLADGIVTVAGEISVTTLDIGGTDVTTTAAELNLIDGGTARGTTAIADGDGVLINDAGTMRMTTVQTLAAYLDDEITAMPNLVETGALDAGSITSGFGTIDTGSSNITTTGLISGGSLDIDDVLINGTTIGHTDDTDLITVADGLVTVAGEISVTTLDIGGTNVTATAAEINLIDGGTSRGTTAIADGDGLLVNDAGTMRMTTVQTLATYLETQMTKIIATDAQIGEDAQTKIDFETANEIHFDTDNVERMKIDADGHIETSTTGKFKQKGAFLQSSTHQAWVLGS